MRKAFVLALVLQVIWNFGTEGLMNEFGGTGCPGVAEIFFGRVGPRRTFISLTSLAYFSGGG